MVDGALDEYVSFYQFTFLPAYRKYIGCLLEKDERILTSTDDAHSLLMQYLHDADAESVIRRQYLSEAKKHLERATLDSYKLVCVYLAEKMEEFVSDADTRLFGINMPQVDVLNAYNAARKNVREARAMELHHSGDFQSIVSLYIESVFQMEKIINHVDPVALDGFEKRIKSKSLRERCIDIVLGILTGVIATVICTLYILPLL